MTLGPRARRLTLTAHVVSSVGWLGAVIASLALAIVALVTPDYGLARGAYLSMEALGWYVLVPLSLASLVTGVVQGLVSRWGLLQHYWVVAKLLINVVASVILLAYLQTFAALADSARRDIPLEELRAPSPVLHAAVATALLLAATVLSIYKPPGRTRYGWRKTQQAG